MTLNEAIKKDVAAVRPKDGHWNPYARLEVSKGGLWSFLIDPPSNLALGHPAEHKIEMLMIPRTGLNPTMDEWDEWVRPADYDSKFGGDDGQQNIQETR